MKHKNTEVINLGDRVKDIITGFEGIAVARTEWMFGCVRVSVQPEKLKEGKQPESQVFDEPQLEIVKRKVIEHIPAKPKPEARTYGPRDDKKALSR